MDSIDCKKGWADNNVSTWYVGPRFYYFGAGMTGLPNNSSGYYPFGVYHQNNKTIILKFRGYRSNLDPEKDRIWQGRKL